MCDCNFSSLVASFFSWRCLAASSSSSLLAAMNLGPPYVTTSTQTSAFNAIVFQSLVMPNARISLCRQSVHFFSFLPRPLRTAPSRLQHACLVFVVCSVDLKPGDCELVVDEGRALQPCRYRWCTHMSCIIIYPYSTYPCRGYFHTQ